ncbi:MAG: ribosome-associated translation inhibitor RaiA [Deltaproteobacteria bacterium]|nr:ribosome-associated translation inhibitor RaiA [Deltaproteobacteria bacterium]
MQVSVTFRNTESKEVLREYVQEKLAKLRKYLDHPLEANVVLAVEKHRHIVEVTLLANRITINAQEENEDMFSAIDRVTDKLERQVLKYKERIRRHKTHSSLPELSWRMDVYAPDSFDEGGDPKVIKSKKLLAKPMSVDEAVMQMDLLNNEFLVFTNANSKSLNIIYRMKDGHYGLIEPQVG